MCSGHAPKQLNNWRSCFNTEYAWSLPDGQSKFSFYKLRHLPCQRIFINFAELFNASHTSHCSLSFFFLRKDFVIWSLKILAQLPAFINNVLELEINLPIFWVEVESIILLVFKCLSHIWFLIISQPDAWSKLWFSIIYLTMDTFILTFHDSDMMMLKKVVMQSFNIFHNWPSSRALKILIDSYCDTSMSLLSWYMENGSALESFISFPLLFFILIYLCFFFK